MYLSTSRVLLAFATFFFQAEFLLVRHNEAEGRQLVIEFSIGYKSNLKQNHMMVWILEKLDAWLYSICPSTEAEMKHFVFQLYAI